MGKIKDLQNILACMEQSFDLEMHQKYLKHRVEI